jgi:hypothetical protein
VDGLRFLCPGCHQNGVARVKDRAEPLRQHVMGHVGEAAEKAGVVPACLLNERLDARPRSERGARLVEADVPVGPQPQQLKVHSAARPEILLICPAGGGDIPRASVGPMDVFRRDVDPAGEFPADDLTVRLRMAGFQSHVFVQQKTLDPAEVQHAAFVPQHQFVVDREGRGSRSQPQDRIGFALQECLDGVRRQGGDLLAARKDHDFHGAPPFMNCLPRVPGQDLRLS